MNQAIIIGVAGGTASGKTTVAKKILQDVGSQHIAHIQHDSYYKDLSHLPLAQRRTFNFDHPDALENALLVSHLQALLAQKPVQVPQYNFAEYIRQDISTPLKPKSVILLEGILIFADKSLRDLMDIKVYVDTDADLRFIRRLERDIAQRGRTIEQVIEQYLSTVRPMHLEFVEPSKRYADVIIPRGGRNLRAIEMVTAQLKQMLSML